VEEWSEFDRCIVLAKGNSSPIQPEAEVDEPLSSRIKKAK